MTKAREVKPGCESLRQEPTLPVKLESMHTGGRRFAEKGFAKPSDSVCAGHCAGHVKFEYAWKLTEQSEATGSCCANLQTILPKELE